MSSGSYDQVYVQCPFYLGDDGRMQIRGEGFGNASSLLLIYARTKHYKARMKEKCCDNYQSCEIYRQLMATKYADED